MARIEIYSLITQYELLTKQLEQVNESLKTLVEQQAEYHYLLSIPGIGETTVIDLLAEVVLSSIINIHANLLN
ncbi:hypothetical protein SFC57_20110 [Niallia circulans]|uniref:hypothetical protein n=1 Tax=Niallia circulans TaxID=1397 RepID=UPI001C2515CE|nr:hypothetical protein [Niallia circulans]